MSMRRLSSTALLCASLTFATAPVSADSGAEHRAAQTLPIKLGASGGNVKDISKAFCCSGTLGALVEKNGTSYVLSNNHVLARAGAAVAGESVSHPGLIDSGCRAKTIVASFSEAAKLGGSNVDAALAKVSQNRVDTTGAILDIGIPASATRTASIGMTLAKSGRTTGFTCGQVSSVLTDLSVQYQKGCNAGKKFSVSYTDQVVVSSSTFSAGGDSGSLMVDAATARPVALLFAGSSTTTIGNPIQDVVAALNIAFVGGADRAVACPTSASAAAATTSTLPARAVERAAAAKQRHATGLLRQRGVQGVGVGVSESDPSAAAVIVYVVAGAEHAPIPAEIEGVPTRVVSTDRFRATGWNESSTPTCSN